MPSAGGMPHRSCAPPPRPDGLAVRAVPSGATLREVGRPGRHAGRLGQSLDRKGCSAGWTRAPGATARGGRSPRPPAMTVRTVVLRAGCSTGTLEAGATARGGRSPRPPAMAVRTVVLRAGCSERVRFTTLRQTLAVGSRARRGARPRTNRLQEHATVIRFAHQSRISRNCCCCTPSRGQYEPPLRLTRPALLGSCGNDRSA